MTTSGYVQHRISQRERILEAAQELFTEKGIEQVTIANVASASRLTRATIYRYFAGKEELAKEIFRSIARSWVERDAREVWGMGGTGHELVERFLTAHFAHLFANPHEARFIAEFNQLYARHLSAQTAMQLFAETLGEQRRLVREAVVNGQADGSIRGDLDPEVVLASVLNLASAMTSRLGELGGKVDAEFGIGADAIFAGVCRVFLDGLRPRPDP